VSAAELDIGGTFDRLWSELARIGRTPTGGYRRFAWTAADSAARRWFVDAALARGLDVQTDRNGNLWAWWLPTGWVGEPRDAFVSGSHLDSVPDGGGYDGPLGVLSALCAVDVVRGRGIEPVRPVGVAVFADEEGARFGVACSGSRLVVGALSAEAARGLTDADGVGLPDAMNAAGVDASTLGQDDEALARIGVFVELHIEQGRALAELDAALGVATGIWPHGRWRFSFEGRANHAGTTRLADRRDPMLAFAVAALAARTEAARLDGLATFGRVHVAPNGTNAVPSRVTGWLDARAATHEVVEAIVQGVEQAAHSRAAADGVTLTVSQESVSPPVSFSAEVVARIQAVVGPLPELGTGAGHDAGVLAAVVPTAMLFVRNPTGVSHSPTESAERSDCLAGVDALAALMADWVGR
jgi:beta-ureidopropionase / N-carbamoyl-L-amino-acid hydrolase